LDVGVPKHSATASATAALAAADPALHAIALDGVTIRRGKTSLLSNVTWRVAPDERWVVLGPNGAGKTTLLALAASKLHPTSGVAHVLGERLGSVDVFELRPRIGLCSAGEAERIPADEVVTNIVLTAAYAVVGRFTEQYELLDEVRARALLDQFGVVHLAERRHGTLSEGERKRVQIARALMTDPELLLLDEPAAGLDLGGREDLVRRLGELAADPASPALVLVTHHVEEIPLGVTHALLLRGGSVVAAGKAPDVLTAENLSATFGLPLAVQEEAGRYYARAL
jgi:iron complex transport system ATP-binding protein